MTDTTVRRLAEGEWTTYRAMRLMSLQQSPEAFAKTFAEEQEFAESVWRDRMKRADRLIATHDGADVGILSMRPADEEFEDSAEIFGLWVRPELRGKGVAVALFQEAVQEALHDGHTHLVYWVGTDNGPGVAFASARGFRPSELRRPMEGARDGEQEIAMVLSVS
ncbi:MAG: GNAT family N-acetyltransferase [Austwickia sp.]|nr:GNAT family N-acetyltransferase [Actinomycetota bacterium]MCB1253651.1 GNAT family N-acetyltransferase [Austwickia sp.]MCO5308750.1 GNAT family N-acetyltransferase [Austwickia sp.]